MSRSVAFPHLGDYAIAFRPLGELVGDVVLPPPMTKRTLELGARHSPESACVPFKYTLGNFIEALERGAEVLIMCGGGCRLGYYGEVQEQILRDLGHRFEFVALSNHSTSLRMLVGEFRRLDRRNSHRRVLRAFELTQRKVDALDRVGEVVRRNAAFAEDPTAFDRLERAFLAEVDGARTGGAVDAVRDEYVAAFERFPQRGRDGALRVGIVGEVYVAMEPFSNHGVERRLAAAGVEVHRPVTVTTIMDAVWGGKPYIDALLADAAPYLTFDIGIDGTKSVAHANRMRREGFDGVVHVKPFGCMPEVSAVPALQRMSREHSFPVLFLTFDAHSAEGGTATRIEAFCDMLRMRRDRPAR